MTDMTKKLEGQPDAAETLSERIRMVKAEGLPRADHNVLQHRERNPLQDFVDSSTRMLEIQRKKVMEAESVYQIDRIKLLDSYRVKLEELKYQAASALRDFDDQYRKDSADARKLLERLNAMRDMPL
jgi:hypothetical protein